MGMMEQLEDKRLRVKMDGTWCGGLMYVDDIVLMAEPSAEFQEMLDKTWWEGTHSGGSSGSTHRRARQWWLEQVGERVGQSVEK